MKTIDDVLIEFDNKFPSSPCCTSCIDDKEMGDGDDISGCCCKHAAVFEDYDAPYWYADGVRKFIASVITQDRKERDEEVRKDERDKTYDELGLLCRCVAETRFDAAYQKMRDGEMCSICKRPFNPPPRGSKEVLSNRDNK